MNTYIKYIILLKNLTSLAVVVVNKKSLTFQLGAKRFVKFNSKIYFQ